MMAEPRLLLGKVVRAWKAASTHQIRRVADPSFAWQSRYYEHVVRSDRALRRIRAYIASNPARPPR